MKSYKIRIDHKELDGLIGTTFRFNARNDNEAVFVANRFFGNENKQTLLIETAPLQSSWEPVE